MFPIQTDSVELTHQIDEYFVNYRIKINQIPMTALPSPSSSQWSLEMHQAWVPTSLDASIRNWMLLWGPFDPWSWPRVRASGKIHYWTELPSLNKDILLLLLLLLLLHFLLFLLPLLVIITNFLYKRSWSHIFLSVSFLYQHGSQV